LIPKRTGMSSFFLVEHIAGCVKTLATDQH